jgi:hypothetical protein
MERAMGERERETGRERDIERDRERQGEREREGQKDPAALRWRRRGK